MAQFRHTPSEAEIERQQQFELQAINRGAERVRRQIDEQALSEGVVGHKLMRQLVPPFVDSIKGKQEEAAKRIASAGRGRQPIWWWLIQTLTPDQLAMITFKAIFSTKPRETSVNLTLTSVALAISNLCHMQLDFEMFKEEQKDVEKETGDSQFKEYLRLNNMMPDAKSFSRYSSKIQRVRLEKWSRDEGIVLGSHLVGLLVDTWPQYFSVVQAKVRGRPEYQIAFSEDLLETISGFAEQAELSHPVLYPTTCPPQPWRRVERNT